MNILVFILFGLFSVQSYALEYHGVLTQGGVLFGKSSDGGEIRLNGRKVEVSDSGYFVVGFGRDAQLNQMLIQSTEQGAQEYPLTLKKRDYKTQYIEGVPQKTVNPPPERLERIRKETALVKSARKTMLDRTDFITKFVVPSEGRVTGVYGSQRVYNGIPKRPHYGIDYAGPTGDPVIAPASGVVTLVHPDMYYSGGTLIVDHGYGLSSTFIHLSEILVEEGDEIRQGDVIAKIGSGGRSTGPHLDWRMNWLDQRVDPALVLDIDLPKGF